MFCHLHLHTEYSLLNGMVRTSEAVKQAKALGMPAVAITDYGNVFGGVEFFLEAKKEGIKPILGCEVFIPSHGDHKLKEFRRGQDALWHLVLLVKNTQGYKNLCRILSESYLHGFYYKPRVDLNLLSQFSDGLIALSSGFSGEVNYHLHKQDPGQARQAAQKYAQIFKDGFYLELQDNGIHLQQSMNRQVLELAKELSLPLVATNNVHYVKREDADAFEVLRGIQLSRMWDSDLDQYRYSTDAYYFRTAEEMRQIFDYCPEAIENTVKIAESIDFQYDFKTYHFPKFETPAGMTLEDMLRKEAWDGLDARWEEIKLVSKKTDADRETYNERLRIELDCIEKMGFAGYFLIVSDFIRWGKDNGIPVGPGRGSAAGSLVAYCTRITDLDPIPYNLLFERFLNPERISMPDVDVDFCQDRRGEVIQYVTRKYGNVSQIITFGKMKAKAVIRDVGRVMEQEYEYVDKIAKLIPNALNIKLKEALEQEPRLQELYDDEETVRRLIDVSLRLEGMARHASVHAAGVIITDKPLWELVPLYKGSADDVVVQYDMKSAEKVGLIKFDFLGLKTLTVIHNAVKNIKKSRGEDLDIAKISMDDKAVYELLSRGDGVGIFQLESSGMRDLMVRLKPGCFEDIVALVALYRPGPLGSGMVDDFIERKKGAKEIVYELPQLETILRDTYGVIVYQEQVMQISARLANYSLGEADLLRRAMGKKDAKEMARQRERFLKGAEENKLDTAKAERIFDLMAMFAEYGFNKSHSAAYALVSYQTAFLKTHYYPEYMAALLSSEMEDTDKIQVFMGDLKAHGTETLPPDINVSDKNFAVEVVANGEGPVRKIRYALCAIKGVGGAAIESIIEARQDGPYKSFYDFCLRVDLRRVTKKVIEMLIKSGAMDGFEMPRKAMVQAIDAMVDAAVRTQKAAGLGQGDLFSEMDASQKAPTGVNVDMKDEWTNSEKLGCEKEAFGFYFSSHPLQPLAESLKKLTTHTIAELKTVPQDGTVTLGGVITAQRVITTKKGDRMAFVTIGDLSGSVEMLVFPRTYNEYRDFLALDEPLLVKGSVDRGQEDVKIKVESMSKLADTLKDTTRSIYLDIPYQSFDSEKLNRILDILGRYQGPSHIFFHIVKAGEFETVVELPPSLSATACEPLKYHIDRLFEGDVVRFQ